MSFQLKTPHRVALMVAAIGAGIGLLAWRADRDPLINFLPGGGPGDWILFPSVPDAILRRPAPVDTVFRRTFTLGHSPRTAPLEVRAARRFEVKINGKPLDVSTTRLWKEVQTFDVLPYLCLDTNAIDVEVYNDNGPPALDLALHLGEVTLRTDRSWEASCAGSAWRPAALASTPRIPGPGNLVAGGESTLEALAEVWPMWVVFLVAAAVIQVAGRIWVNRSRSGHAAIASDRRRWGTAATLSILAGLWIVLFMHNTNLLPDVIGFDSRFHLDYIRYVQEHGAVPLADQGLEMFQPPLYYGMGALGLQAFHRSVTDQPGTVLRLLGMLFGIAHFTLVFLSLRLLIPGRIVAQLVGLALAAFSPMLLYVSQYPTNETPAATLAAATMYLCLRVLKSGKGSPAQYAGLGICLGAAMLAKVTDVLLTPIVIIALADRLSPQRPSPGIWLRTAGLTLAVACVVCGWYYARVWIHFGTPLVGAWNVTSGFAWWQDPGYHTVGDYTRFGRSLFHPLFSGFAGFWDGVYSTLWGDGLCGGTGDLTLRPPWNYHLIVAGYWLAIVPTLLLLCGAGAAVWRYLTKPASDQFVPLAFFGAVAFGLLFMSLEVPVYAQVKAFYGLGALLSLCLFGAVGWEVLTRGRKLLQFALGTALTVWAMNSFASMWIRNGTAQPHILRGIGFASQKKGGAAISEFAAAATAEPVNVAAKYLLAQALSQSNRMSEAVENANRAVELDPTNPRAHLKLGTILARQGQWDRAVAEARRAAELGPEYTAAYQSLATLFFLPGRSDAASEAARDGLAVSPWDPPLHLVLGLSRQSQGDRPAAIRQLKYAVLMRPDWDEARLDLGMILLQMGEIRVGLEELGQAVSLAPDHPALLNEVAWALATFPDAAARNGPEAVRLAEHACALDGDKDPKLLKTLAAAYAEVGRFPEAIHRVQQAISLARSPGNESTAALSQEMLRRFQSNYPYRQNPTPAP